MLTAKQEKFARCIVEGMTQADAYRSAYNCKQTTDKTVQESASRLMADPNISARVQELRDKAAISTIMTAQERMEWLTELIRSNREKTRDKLTAADIMNKMQGEYVQKVEADVKSKVDINIALSDD